MAEIPNLERKMHRTAFACVGIVVGMVGLAYASVPLYDLFCKVTGFGGTLFFLECLGLLDPFAFDACFLGALGDEIAQSSRQRANDLQEQWRVARRHVIEIVTA